MSGVFDVGGISFCPRVLTTALMRVDCRKNPGHESVRVSDGMVLSHEGRGGNNAEQKDVFHSRTGWIAGIVGYLRHSFGGAFRVFDAGGNEVALVKGDWKGWNFRFLDKSGNEIGTITKKWAGIGKELFTSADNYIITLNHCHPIDREHCLE